MYTIYTFNGCNSGTKEEPFPSSFYALLSPLGAIQRHTHTRQNPDMTRIHKAHHRRITDTTTNTHHHPHVRVQQLGP